MSTYLSSKRTSQLLAITAFVSAACLLAGTTFAQSSSRPTTQSSSRTATQKAPTVNRTTSSQNSVSSSKGIAVVELFTSQGCSSCPSADAVLKQIDGAAKTYNHPVFVLSFHVDYWNRLGWDDPYSSPAYSKRQRSYASARGSRRVYTPQMIVNGATEFVGSKRDQANAAISASLKTPATIAVQLAQPKVISGKSATVTYALKGQVAGQYLHVAIVATPKSNRIPRGENSGRSLSHVNVVRAFTSTRISGSSGTVTLELPEGLDAANAKVIAYVQNPRDLKIGGASARSLQAS